MVKSSITIKEVVDFLNELLEIDPVAINSVFAVRVPCNFKLAMHDTVQVGSVGNERYQVGIIGILNGLFGKDKLGWGHLSFVYDDETGMLRKVILLSEDDTVRYA